MPFKSAKQRAWMFINKPRLAKKWANKYGTAIRPSKRNTQQKRGK